MKTMSSNKALRATVLALAVLGTVGTASLVTAVPANADDRRWNHRYWDRGDWRRHYPNYYVAPGYIYAPPPVVYAPPPVYPGFSLHFGF